MADEARAMLDALMGGDRNAPLPKGASLKRGSNEGPVLVSTKKQKSCYDHDVDPLYCAWGGVDVYDLFVNTKSDIGPNPKIPSDSAKDEYAQLPKHEQERLGFEHMLFTKLQDLTRMCDRTVSRNKEKLRQEQQRQQQQQQGGSMDYVTDVDEVQVERLCRAQLDMDNVLQELEEKEKQLQDIIQQEVVLQQAKKVKKNDEGKEEDESKEEAPKEDKKEGTAEAPNPENEKEPTEEKQAEEKADSDTNEANKEESSKDKDEADTKDETETPNEEPLSKEEMELLLKRQKLLFDMARILQQYAPIQNAVESQKEHLHVVKSDISSDKTVCEISGNFMSARDADERIAAHYAGKQYVGWKLVRDKLKEMVQQYGRYGPPRGGGRGDYGGSRGGDYRGGGDRYRRGPSPPQQQRWDRGGRDRGGGYDGRGGSYSRYGGGGGGGGDWRRGGRDRGGHWRR